jgi:hypothetical protein
VEVNSGGKRQKTCKRRTTRKERSTSDRREGATNVKSRMVFTSCEHPHQINKDLLKIRDMMHLTEDCMCNESNLLITAVRR